MYACTSAVRRRRAGTLLLILLSGAACQAWHTEGVASEAILATHQPGRLRVTRVDGSRIVLKRPVLQGDTLVGIGHRQSDQQAVRVALTDVRQVETRGFSSDRTAWLVVGVTGGLVGAFLVAYAIACRGGACSN